MFLYRVVGHTCSYLPRNYMGNVNDFLASSLISAKAFVSKWGGEIQPI